MTTGPTQQHYKNDCWNEMVLETCTADTKLQYILTECMAAGYTKLHKT